MPETLFIVDTFSLIFQVFYAIRQPMSGRRGQPTNAVFGVTGDIRFILRDHKPTHLIFALDSPGDAERNTIYPEYKANRESAPDDLLPQIPMVIDVIEGHRIPAISVAGWEADDVMATLARQAVERGMEVKIVTNDKDARQLIGPQVQLYNIRKRKFMDEAFLLADWGVRPDQVIDFQALVGDSVDNVPGVPLVGPKKAGALLAEFDTLEAVLANADKAPGKKLSENLKTYAEQARLSKDLVTLRTDLQIDVDWDAAKVQTPNYTRLHELFTDYGFGRYADEIRDKMAEENIEDSHERLWQTVDTPVKFEKFLVAARQQQRLCVDLETTSKIAMQADIVGWAVCWKADMAYYIPVDGPDNQSTLAADVVLAAFKPILVDPDVRIDNQNIKYDMLVLKRLGVDVRAIGMDPMIADYLLDAGARSHGLDRLAKVYLHRRTIPNSDLIGKGKRQKLMFEVDVDRAAEHASEDADIAFQVSTKISEELKKQSLWDLYWGLERELIPVLVDMEYQGIRVDVDELRRQSEALSVRLAGLMTEIHDMAGREFNIDSPLQLRAILFDELKLPIRKRTKTGPSTDQDVLERLALEHPLPDKIIEHRHMQKLKNTYLDSLPTLVHPETGRIHASFNQVVAATGRLSSSDPNLQNIPIRTDEGRLVRKAFIPSESGWKLLSADYSQIELRMLAHFSRDAAMLEAFREGIDIHTAVAADINDVPPESVTPDMRRVAKAVNFGVIYGQTPWGLAAALRIPKDDAKRFIEDYFEKYSGVSTFIEQVLNETAASGYATTILGRRRAITGVRSKRKSTLNLSERTAVNTVIQGSAADLIKRAMINVHARLRQERHPGRMLLQIHDELVFEVPESEVASLQDLVVAEMTSALEVDVALVVDTNVGDTWLDAK
ncbi:MAG: DNA polymerase I [Planctomycetota bacterium]|nr:DNA polymerase I [Planctomycetota bacterium]